MYKWYERYSYWVIILAILYKLGISSINVYPSVLFTLVSTIVLVYLKFINKVPMSTTYLVYTGFVHTFPLLLVPHTLATSDIVKNIFVYLTYIACITLYGKNVYQIYKKGVYVDSNKDLSTILNDRGIMCTKSR